MLADADWRDLSCWLAQCRRIGWRAIVHVAGDAEFCHALQEQLLQRHGIDVADFLQPDQPCDATTWQNRLGDETDCLVIDAFAGFNPNVLGMASATLRGGGLLVLLTPPLADWPQYPDPDYQRLSADDKHAIAGRFIKHCCHSLARCNMLASITPPGRLALTPFSIWRDFSVDLSGQQQAVQMIRRVATGHARRPLVLTADRGRGKSAALGMASAALMLEKPVDIVVTAVSTRAVTSLFRHLADGLQQLFAGVADYHHGDSRIRFLAIDRLLAERPVADLLIVDEAAALPVPLLTQLLAGYNRLVFATTINGYEGSGQGFRLRFAAELKRQMPQARFLQLTESLRWAAADPLELLVSDMLLLGASHDVLSLPAGDAPVYVELSRDMLVSQPQLLRQLFGLLIEAHYQTTPDDLRLLLDHPAVRVMAALSADAVLAVALVMQEGGFSAGQQAHLAAGGRLRGHLLPQALWGDGMQEALAFRYARIVRIAVQPGAQRQGIGRRLLGLVEQIAGCDIVGASFSAETGVLRFWQSCGMQALRLGSRRETSTGEYAVVVVKPCHAQAGQALAQKRVQWAQDLPCQLPRLNRELDAGLVSLLLLGLPLSATDHDVRQCQHYVLGWRGFEQALPSLLRVVLAAAAAGKPVPAPVSELLLLGRDWQALAEKYKLAGRKAVERQLRDWLACSLPQPLVDNA